MENGVKQTCEPIYQQKPAKQTRSRITRKGRIGFSWKTKTLQQLKFFPMSEYETELIVQKQTVFRSWIF